jgi:hypothetical protein
MSQVAGGTATRTAHLRYAKVFPPAGYSHPFTRYFWKLKPALTIAFLLDARLSFSNAMGVYSPRARQMILQVSLTDCMHLEIGIVLRTRIYRALLHQ